MTLLFGTPSAEEAAAILRGEPIDAHLELVPDGEDVVVLESALGAWFAKRLAAHDAEYQKSFAELECVLLDRGGRHVEVPAESPIDPGALVRDGRFLTPGPVRRMVGPPNRCHRTTAYLVDTGLVDRGMTGYALGVLGMWVEHSWGMIGDVIIEPTRERWLAYFGASSEEG